MNQYLGICEPAEDGGLGAHLPGIHCVAAA